MVSKILIQRHKDMVHGALADLYHTVNSCSKEIPRTVVIVLDALEDAANDHALSTEERNIYKEYILSRITQFENKCSCKTL